MNQAHLHIILVHFPIVLVPIGIPFLLYGLKAKNPSVSQAALWLFLFAALLGVPAYLLGEGAEDVVKKLGIADKHLIHEHEEAALFALIGVSILAALSLVTLVFRKIKNQLPHQLLYGILLIAVITAATLIQTGQRGGMIRHPEAFDLPVQPTLSSSLTAVNPNP